MTWGLWRGAAAGAAGTTALNAATYLDMVVRGRRDGSAPQDLVEAAAGRAGMEIPGHGEQRDNRLAGPGPLSGTAVGVFVGLTAVLAESALRASGRQVPAPVPVVFIAAAAMALSDVPRKLFGISDPASWRRKAGPPMPSRTWRAASSPTPPSMPGTGTDRGNASPRSDECHRHRSCRAAFPDRSHYHHGLEQRGWDLGG